MSRSKQRRHRSRGRRKQSQVWVDLLIALPSSLLLVATIVTAVLVMWNPENRLILAYKSAAKEALAKNDLRTAELGLQRLTELEDDRPESRFNLAELWERHGQMARALATMQQLAPPDRPGYADAHFWLVEDARRTGEEGDSAIKSRAALKFHLQQTVDQQPTNLKAKDLLGRLLLAEGKVDQALPLLTAAAKAHPQSLYGSLVVLRRRGELEEAERLARVARSLLVREYEEARTSESGIELAKLEFLTGKFDRAVEILEETLEHAPTEEVKNTLLNSYLNAIRSTRNGEKKLRMIKSAIDLIEEPERFLQQLDFFVGEESANRREAKRLLEVSLAEGRAEATCHYLLGTMAIADEDLAKAQTHLETAYSLRPQDPKIANNFAWCLTRRDPAELDRALEILDKTIARVNSPAIRETRGQVYLQMERYNEAVTDLEFAVRRLNLPEIHASLATAYERLGSVELAKQHRSLSQQN